MTPRPGPQTQPELDAMIARQDAEERRVVAEFVASDRRKKYRAIVYALCQDRDGVCMCSLGKDGVVCAQMPEVTRFARVAVDVLEGLKP